MPSSDKVTPPLLTTSSSKLDNESLPSLDDTSTPIGNPPLEQVLKLEQIDFLGVDNFNVFYDSFVLKLINMLKVNFVLNAYLVEFQISKRLKQLRYSKYLILWHGRVQFLTESLKWGEVLTLVVPQSVVSRRLTLLQVASFKLGDVSPLSPRLLCLRS